MRGADSRTLSRRGWQIPLLYAAVGVAWIIVTDLVVERSSTAPALNHFIQSWKGTLFILLTAAMLYGLLQQTFRTIAVSHERIVHLANQLRSLASHERRSREDERARIARDLHDELGQQLTGLKFDVAAMAGGSAGLRERLNELSASLDEAIRTVRRLSTELRPGVLDQLGLAAALEWVAQDYSRRTGMRATVEVTELDVPGEIATAIFRVVQESLTNVARHAQATEFSVRLVQTDDTITLAVGDNGRGFRLDGEQGFGILGMRERVGVLGGDFRVGPGPDGIGTEVSCSFPLTRQAAA
jgi:signal transduction histidine kinase